MSWYVLKLYTGVCCGAVCVVCLMCVLVHMVVCMDSLLCTHVGGIFAHHIIIPTHSIHFNLAVYIYMWDCSRETGVSRFYI